MQLPRPLRQLGSHKPVVRASIDPITTRTAPMGLLLLHRGLHMAAIFGDGRRGDFDALKRLFGLISCALVAAACTSTSYGAAAIEASQSGDQKSAVILAKKEVARFSTPSQCSRNRSFNCGTLALAYGSLAEYQILNGDKTAGETSFGSAKCALGWMDSANRPSATAMVYRDVSEAYWKMGDRARATVVFNEGRAAGADGWLFAASAAGTGDRGPAEAR